MTDPNTYTAAQAADPNTPAEVLWAIAQNRPDLRGTVALNPQAPAELHAWLAMNQEFPHEGSSNTYTATAPVPAPPLPDTSSAQPVEAAAYGLPNASQVPATQNYAVDAGLTSPGNGSTQYPAQYSAEGETPAKKSTKKWIIIGAITALIVAGAAIALNALVFSKLSGSKTPEAAVTKLFESLEQQDMVAVYGSVTPSEIDLVQDSYAQFSKHFEGEPLGQDPQDFLADALKAYTFDFDQVELSVENINDNTARVQLTQGTIKIDGDAQKFSSVINDALEGVKGTGLGSVLNDAGVPWPTQDELQQEIETSFKETFPATVNASDLVIPVQDLTAMDLYSFDEDLDLDSAEPAETVPFTFVVTKEDNGWYVSPVRTLVDLSSASSGERIDFSAPVQATGSDSPEGAAQAWVDANFEGLKTLDFTSPSQYLAQNERLLSGFQTSNVLGSEAEIIKEALAGISVEPVEFALDRTEGDKAYLTLTSLKIGGEIEGMSASVDLTSECANIAAGGMPMNLCIQDIPAARELGLDQLRLITVKENGKWFVSSSLTSADSMGILASNVLRLAEEGHLTDGQWWMDNLGVLGQIASEF